MGLALGIDRKLKEALQDLFPTGYDQRVFERLQRAMFEALAEERLVGPAHAPALTPKQFEMLAFLVRHEREHGWMPTLVEIGTATGRTKITVWEHIRKLAGKGLVKVRARQARNIELTPAGRLAVARKEVQEATA